MTNIASIARANDQPLSTPSEYTVRPGDTLWDISDQLMDDPLWWPKLWSFNSGVKNPNLIYPGMKLIFVPSDGTNAPMLNVIDTQEKYQQVTVSSPLVTEKLSDDGLAWQSKDGQGINFQEISADKSIDSEKSLSNGNDFLIRIPGFISDDTPQSVGRIADLTATPLYGQIGETSFAEFDTNVRPGEQFMTVRPYDGIDSPLSKGSSGDDIYIFTGVVGVSKINRNNIATVSIISSSHGVAKNDILLPFQQIFKSVNLTESATLSSIRTEVIATLDTAMHLASRGQTVFLKRVEGAKIGDDIQLYMPPEGVVSADAEGLDGYLVAKARIVAQDNESIVAIILQSRREVAIGARTFSDFDLEL